MNFNQYGNFNQQGMNNPFFSPRERIGDRIKKFFKSGSVLSRLIAINLAIFLIINIYNLFLKLMGFPLEENGIFSTNTITYWLSVPSNIDVLLEKPWSIITYMFTHQHFFHIFVNMLLLYMFGKLFLSFLNKKQLLISYFLGGLVGASFYIVAYNYFPEFATQKDLSLALGASASVMAVVVSISTYIPNYQIRLFLFGSIKLKWIAIFYIIFDLFSIDGDNPGGHIAHLGGATFGLLYVLFIHINAQMVKKNKTNPFKAKKDKTTFKTKRGGRPISDEDYNRKRASDKQKTDKILEKISKSGYSSLTKEEKDYLFNN